MYPDGIQSHDPQLLQAKTTPPGVNVIIITIFSNFPQKNLSICTDFRRKIWRFSLKNVMILFLPKSQLFELKSPFFLKFLANGNVAISCDDLEYFMAIWFNLWQFSIFCGHLVYFNHFGMFGPRKIWQHCSTVAAFF
jgi:hypothetical protein